MKRINSPEKANLLLLNYDEERFTIISLMAIPKQFLMKKFIEKRRQLSPNARRAGWVGCNILLDNIPRKGRVFFIDNATVIHQEAIIKNWANVIALTRNKNEESKGWLWDVMYCIDLIGKSDFTLKDVYVYENILSKMHPENNNIKAKIRQQMQILRDNGYLEFQGKGHYHLQ